MKGWVNNADEKKEYDEFIINHVKVKIITMKPMRPPKDFEPKYVFNGDYTG